MIEHCERCQDLAPRWDDPAYASWYLALAPDGFFLSIVCPGCYLDEDSALPWERTELWEGARSAPAPG